MKRYLRYVSIWLLCSLLVATRCFAAITLTQITSNVQHTGTSLAKAFASNVTAGSLLVYGCAVFSTAGNPTLTITDNNTNTIALVADAIGSQVASKVSYVSSAHSGATTMTCSVPTGVDIDIVLAEYAGVGGPTVENAGVYLACVNPGCFPVGQTTVLTGPITPSAANSLIVSYVYDVHSSHTWSVNNSFTIEVTTTNPDGATSSFADKILTSSSSTSVTWTNNGAAGQISAIIADFPIPAATFTGYPYIANLKQFHHHRYKGSKVESPSINHPSQPWNVRKEEELNV